MTNYRELCAELLAALKIQLDELADSNRLCKKAEALLAEPMPTVDELHKKSGFNYMVEDLSWIVLDGVFSRQELLELGYSKPPEEMSQPLSPAHEACQEIRAIAAEQEADRG